MQEQKEFGTALFGFEKKAVLEYIYEQDKQARSALEELARRNASLEDERKLLNDKLMDLGSRYDRLSESAAADQQNAKQAASDCDLLKDRLGKLSAQFHEKENSLQLQMEINKKMQSRITEQQALIEKLQKELHTAEDRIQIFHQRQQDYTDMHERLERFKNEFTRRMAEFENEFAKLEVTFTPMNASMPASEPQKPDSPRVTRVSPRIRLDDERPASAILSSGAGNTGAASPNKNRLKTIFDEWK